MELSEFAHLLACPETLEPLTLEADGRSLTTADGRSYPVENGVPILLTAEDRRLFEKILGDQGRKMVEQYRVAPPAPAEPGPDPDEFPPMRLPRDIIHRAYTVRGEATRILSIGGGPARGSAKDINLNMGPFPEVDVVGNAIRLPIRTGSADGVFSNAVLEHVTDARRAVAEMIRVVAPGGHVINLVPFMQPIHAYPLDLQRYTPDGLAHLMRDLEILDRGQAVGPSYALWELLSGHLNGPGMICIPRWIRGIARRTLLPALRRSAAAQTDWTLKPEHQLMPSLVYCIGRKR